MAISSSFIKRFALRMCSDVVDEMSESLMLPIEPVSLAQTSWPSQDVNQRGRQS